MVTLLYHDAHRVLRVSTVCLSVLHPWTWSRCSTMIFRVLKSTAYLSGGFMSSERSANPKGVNLLFDQNFPKTAWKWRQLGREWTRIRNLSMYIHHCICLSCTEFLELSVQMSTLVLSMILSIWDRSHLPYTQKGLKSVISSCLLFSKCYCKRWNFGLRINGDGTCLVSPGF